MLAILHSYINKTPSISGGTKSSSAFIAQKLLNKLLIQIQITYSNIQRLFWVWMAVAHAFNPSTWEAGAGETLSV